MAAKGLTIQNGCHYFLFFTHIAKTPIGSYVYVSILRRFYPCVCISVIFVGHYLNIL